MSLTGTFYYNGSSAILAICNITGLQKKRYLFKEAIERSSLKLVGSWFHAQSVHPYSPQKTPEMDVSGRRQQARTASSGQRNIMVIRN